MMATASRTLRLLIFAAIALAAAGILWAVFGALRSAIALWQEVRALPDWLQIFIALLCAAILVGCIWIGWRILRAPRRRKAPVAAPTRSEVDAQLSRLREQRTDTAQLQAELEELDRRAQSEELYVAVFGEISAGKSSLIRALAPAATAQVDVIGGTTRAVAHYRGQLGARSIVLADVPGSHEAAGAAREQIARDEALRAHVVLYVCAGDLTRDQDAELRWLRSFGKPLLLLLNKADQFDDNERATLERILRERYGNVTDAQFALSAGGSETFERVLADGRREQVRRERLANLGALLPALQRLADRGAQALEPAREAAVLSSVAAKSEELAHAARDRESDAIVNKYTKRAVVGALAAVIPGSDLVIQGVLAAALIRELAKLYEVPVRDMDIDAFLGQVKLTVRTSTSIVLAIAGNALKAFPGFGTLGGGALHAIAYGLIFDSLGHAVASTLRTQHALDTETANATLAQLLAQASGERMRRIADYALGRDDAVP